jgi:hypothetical protein
MFKSRRATSFPIDCGRVSILVLLRFNFVRLPQLPIDSGTATIGKEEKSREVAWRTAVISPTSSAGGLPVTLTVSPFAFNNPMETG